MLVRQLLEMLELVTRMESTYLTRIDLKAQRQLVLYAHNSSEMQIRKGFRCRGMSRCVNVQSMMTASSVTMSSTRWPSCIAAQGMGIITFFSIPVRLADGSLYGTLCATSRNKQPYNLEGEQVMELFANLISHYIEKDAG